MANTYTQIYIHIVFAVKGRQSLLPESCRDELFKYITGIVKNRNQKLIAINGTGDHIHIFVGMRPTITLSDLVRDIKAGSSGFINERNWVSGRFNWQEGFGAFSCSHSDIGRVIKYIDGQKGHHAKIHFRDEYLSMLKQSAVEYDERYLFSTDDQSGIGPPNRT